MTNPELPIPELETLETLEPMSGGMPAPAAGAASVKIGAAPPFYRSDAHGEYYKFLFAGLVMTLGCLMPFSSDVSQSGYTTLSGALFLILALCLVWSMWIAVYGGRFRMKWIMLALLPFAVILLDFIFVDGDSTVKAFREVNKTTPIAESWLEAIKGAFSRTTEGNAKAANLCRAFGTGRIIVFFGGLLNFMFLLTAVFGGAKHGAKQKAAVRAAAASGRAR